MIRQAVSHGRCALSPLLRRAIATACEDDVKPILEDVEEFVVAAGGDGTVRAVADELN